MDPRSNFVGVMKDLDDCSSSWDQYHLLRIPGLLRLLLYDSLVDQVNRQFRFKLRFMVGHVFDRSRVESASIDLSDVMVASVGDSFDPQILALDQTASTKPREVTRDGLLKAIVLIAEGRYITVGDLIEHLAYVHGLTHPGSPKGETDEILLTLRRLVQIGGTALGMREIRSVGRVVHRALEPLRSAVIEKYAEGAG